MSQKEKDDNNSIETKKDMGGETDKSKMSAEQQMFENNMRETMKALNIKSTDSDINIVCEHEKIWPKKIPNYKVYKHYIKGEKLGKGSFATVREFVDQKSVKRVAGKIYKKIDLLVPNDRMGVEYSSFQQTLKQNIEKEFRLVHKLDHINVIKIFDRHETDKKIYLFMEYGIAVLDEFLKAAPNHKLPKWQCHRYYTQLIEGLDYLHDNGVIHGDIKPENLIVDTSDVIKICDFGVCHILDWFAPNDHIMKYDGTLLYQPPESCDYNITYHSGTKCDIWSSGVTLYQMVSGKLPFKGSDEIISAKFDYHSEIISDAHLSYLLKGILTKHFNNRLTITEIKKHEWFIRKHPPNSKPVSVPIMPFGDIYRSMTVLPRLEYHYYMQTSPQNSITDELVTVEEDDTIRDPKYRISPTIRSNRKLKKLRSPHGKKNPARRVLFGFLQ